MVWVCFPPIVQRGRARKTSSILRYGHNHIHRLLWLEPVLLSSPSLWEIENADRDRSWDWQSALCLVRGWLEAWRCTFWHPQLSRYLRQPNQSYIGDKSHGLGKTWDDRKCQDRCQGIRTIWWRFLWWTVAKIRLDAPEVWYISRRCL